MYLIPCLRFQTLNVLQPFFLQDPTSIIYGHSLNDLKTLANEETSSCGCSFFQNSLFQTLYSKMYHCRNLFIISIISYCSILLQLLHLSQCPRRFGKGILSLQLSSLIMRTILSRSALCAIRLVVPLMSLTVGTWV